MLRFIDLSLTWILCVLLLCSFQKPAYGYTDPGSSLLLFQSLSSILTGGLFFFRKQLRGFFGRLNRRGVSRAKIAE